MSFNTAPQGSTPAVQPTFREHQRALWRVCPVSMGLLIASAIVTCTHVLIAGLNDHLPENAVFIPVCLVAVVSGYIRYIKEDEVNTLSGQLAQERVDRAAGINTQPHRS